MRYPEFLKPNGRIGLIAPSFGCTSEPYLSLLNETEKMFGDMGYSCVEGPNCRINIGDAKSNTSEKCGEEINDFFLNDRSDIIISVGGGEMMCENLPFVDFDAIGKAVPKWYLGYSDNTNLVFTLPTLSDTAAIYGPNAPTFGQKPRHKCLDDTLDLLTGKKLSFENYPSWEIESLKSADNPFAPFNCTEPCCIKAFGSSEFSGRLLGGCLDCLIVLCGTRFDRVKEFNKRYEKDGVVWFIESFDLSSIGVRRSLWQLRQAGWFDCARGFIIGRPIRYRNEDFGISQRQAVIDALGDMNLPIVLDADIGHLPPSMPVIAGAFAEITASDGSLNINHILK